MVNSTPAINKLKKQHVECSTSSRRKADVNLGETTYRTKMKGVRKLAEVQSSSKRWRETYKGCHSTRRAFWPGRGKEEIQFVTYAFLARFANQTEVEILQFSDIAVQFYHLYYCYHICNCLNFLCGGGMYTVKIPYKWRSWRQLCNSPINSAIHVAYPQLTH